MLEKFQEKKIADPALIGAGPILGISITLTLNWDGWLDGSMFDGVKGNNLNEFDK